MPLHSPLRVLGIDPGFGRVGYGVIEQTKKGEWRHIVHGLIETDPKQSFIQRLEEVYTDLQAIIKEFSPSVAGVEELFFYKNVSTAMNVAQARGVILLTLLQSNIHVFEYTPLEVKQAIVGYGRADKKQIQYMVQLRLQLKKGVMQDDAADALAIALTCGSNYIGTKY